MSIGRSRTDDDRRRDRGGGVAETLLQLGLMVNLGSKPLATVYWLGLKTRDGLRDDTRRHRESCIDTKQSREKLVVVGCTDLHLDYFAPGLNGSYKISKSKFGVV